MIAFQCPKCQATLKTTGEKAGLRSKCPKCGCPVQVPKQAPIEEVIEVTPADLLPEEIAPAIPHSLTRPRTESYPQITLPSTKGTATNPGRWWRPVSPSLLVLALLVFPLPWIEISCSAGDMKRKVLSSQSGLQSIYGGRTLPPALEAQRRVLGGRGQLEDQTQNLGFWDSFAPFMLAWVPLLAAAVFFGFFLRPSYWRAALITLPVGLVFFLLLVQVAIGFPLERQLYKGLEFASKSGTKDMEGVGVAAALAFDVHYTVWFWIGLLSIMASLLTLALEWFAIRSTYDSRPPTWIRAYMTMPEDKVRMLPASGGAAKEKRSFPLWAITALASGVLLVYGGGGVMLVKIATWQMNGKEGVESEGDNSKTPLRQAEQDGQRQFIPHRPALLQNDSPAIKVSAGKLYRDYRKDLLAADAKYLHKRMELSQVSGKIEKDQQGGYYLAALKIRAVKRAGSGARITSPEDSARRIYEAAANAKYEPALIIYLKPAEISAFQGVKETDQLVLEGLCAAARRDPNTTPDVVVILEDAKLISKTTPPLPPPKPVHNPPASFSLTNPQDAHEWLALAAQEPPEARSNEIIRTKAREELAKKLAGLCGLHVEWQLSVQSVNARMIFVSPIRSPYAPNGSALIVTSEESMEKPIVVRSPARRPRPPVNQKPPAPRISGLPRFPHHNEPWLQKLKKGSVIKVSGQIKAVDGRGNFIVFLSDWKITPVE